MNIKSSQNKLINLIDLMHQKDVFLAKDKNNKKSQKIWKDLSDLEIEFEKELPHASQKDIKEAFLHSSNLDWHLFDDYYDGFEWKTTQYGSILSLLIKDGHGGLLKDLLSKSPSSIPSSATVQFAGELLTHNNSLLIAHGDYQTLSKSPKINQWTKPGFIQYCLDRCEATDLMNFADVFVYEPLYLSTILKSITSPTNKDMQEHIKYLTRSDFLIDIFPANKNITPKEMQIGDLMKNTLPLANDILHFIADMGNRVSNEPSSKSYLLNYYKPWLEKINLMQFRDYDYKDEFCNQCLDIIIPILPPSVQNHIANQPQMHLHQNCSIILTKNQLEKELENMKISSKKHKKI